MALLDDMGKILDRVPVMTGNGILDVKLLGYIKGVSAILVQGRHSAEQGGQLVFCDIYRVKTQKKFEVIYSKNFDVNGTYQESKMKLDVTLTARDKNGYCNIQVKEYLQPKLDTESWSVDEKMKPPAPVDRTVVIDMGKY